MFHDTWPTLCGAPGEMVSTWTLMTWSWLAIAHHRNHFVSAKNILKNFFKSKSWGSQLQGSGEGWSILVAENTCCDWRSFGCYSFGQSFVCRPYVQIYVYIYIYICVGIQAPAWTSKCLNSPLHNERIALLRRILQGIDFTQEWNLSLQINKKRVVEK